MKKHLGVFPILFVLVFVLTGCPGPINNPDVPVPGRDSIDSTDTEQFLSPDEQKNLLVAVGGELINTFNPADQKKAVDLAENLYHKYLNYDWDAIEEELWEEYDDIYSSEFESFFGMPKRIINVINGKQNATLEDMEILLTLSKFGRVIEFDDQTKSIKITKTSDPSVTAKFSDSKGTKCELKVWGEGKEIEGLYTYEDDGKRTIRVKVPTTIKMHLKQGSSALISMNFTWDSNLKDYVNTSMNLQVINLGFEEEIKASTTEASAVFSFTYSNKNIITAAVNLPKYKLIEWEGGKDFTEDEFWNWLEEYDEKYASLLGKVGKGEAKLDILSKIQLKGGVTDGAALVDAYYNWEDKYYNNELDECNDLCKLLNKYIYLSVYYNNTTTEQAKLLMDVYEDEYGYDVEPIMQFPYDDSQIAVMTYFTSSKFLGLVDLVEELANSYIALDKNHLIFDEDFVLDLGF